MEYLEERQCCSEREILKQISLFQSIAMVCYKTSCPEQSYSCQCHPRSFEAFIETIDERGALQEEGERKLFQDHPREERFFINFVEIAA